MPVPPDAHLHLPFDHLKIKKSGNDVIDFLKGTLQCRMQDNSHEENILRGSGMNLLNDSCSFGYHVGVEGAQLVLPRYLGQIEI